MRNRKERLELISLILEAKDENLDKERFLQLDRMIARDPLAAEHYVELIAMYTALSQPGRALTSLIPLKDVSESQIDFRCLKELAEYEKSVKAVKVERVKDKAEPVLTEAEREAKIRAFIAEERAKEEQERLLAELQRRKIRQREIRRRKRIAWAHSISAKVKKYATISAIAAVGMVIAYFLYALLMPAPVASVAKLTDRVNLKWADPDLPTELNSLLRPGYMKLVEGYAEISFEGGAKAIIQAPVEIKLQSADKAYVKSGKMTAKVPIEARGFTLNTPSASIVDLGTEFGVNVAEDGSSDIHVFRGEVSLLAGRIDNLVGKLFDTVEQIVEAGQARRVKAGSSKIQNIQFGQKAFVWDMPSPYELAIRKNRPIGYWRFSRDDSEKCVNSIGSTDHFAEYVGRVAFDSFGPDLGDGNPNDALKLGGDGYVFVGDVQLDAPRQGGCTIVLWVRPNILRKQIIVLQDGSQDDSDAGLERLLLMDENGQLGFYQIANNDYIVKVLSNKKVQAGLWYHVAVSLTNDNLKLFINGQLQEAQVNTTSQMLNPNLLWYMYIGSDPEYKKAKKAMLLLYSGRSVLWPYSPLKGEVDEVALFNRALSAEEIRQLYMSAE